MTYWPDILIKGSALDLKHLSPFIFECPTPKDAKPDSLRVNVRYSNHVFSEEFKPEVHSEDTIIMDHNRKRAFCKERYDLSFKLPEILETLHKSKVHQTASRRNYIHIIAITSLNNKEYQIFFTLKKEKTKLANLDLFVESAYLGDRPAQLRKRPNAIRFPMLALKVHQGKEIRFAAR